jgi:hypothetical protein
VSLVVIARGYGGDLLLGLESRRLEPLLKSQKSPRLFTGIDATAFASVMAVAFRVAFLVNQRTP